MANDIQTKIEYLVRDKSRKMAQEIFKEIEPLIREDTINDVKINYPMAFTRDNYIRVNSRIENRLFRMVLDMAKPPIMDGVLKLNGNAYFVFAYISRTGQFKYGKVLVNDLFIEEASFNAKYPTKVERDITPIDDPDYAKFIKSIM